jgi:hypothetical protein
MSNLGDGEDDARALGEHEDEQHEGGSSSRRTASSSNEARSAAVTVGSNGVAAAASPHVSSSTAMAGAMSTPFMSSSTIPAAAADGVISTGDTRQVDRASVAADFSPDAGSGGSSSHPRGAVGGAASYTSSPTSSVCGDTPDWDRDGDLYITSNGDIIGKMREAPTPVATEQQLAAIPKRIDLLSAEWRAAIQRHPSADQNEVHKIVAVISRNATRLNDLVKAYEDSVDQHSALSKEMSATLRCIRDMIGSPIYPESLRRKHKYYYHELKQQLARVLEEQLRQGEDLAELKRQRDRASALKGQVAGIIPAMEIDTNEPFVTSRATSSTDSGSVIHLKTVPPTHVTTSPHTMPTTVATGASSRSAPLSTAWMSGSNDIIPSSECMIDEVSECGGVSGPRLKIDRWSDMTNIRTKLRQLNQMTASYPIAVRRQYLCQALPLQIIMVTVRDPDGTTKTVDVYTLSYHGMVRALLLKFDSQTDREIARTKLNTLKMRTHQGDQQLQDYPSYFHDNSFWPLLESCYKVGHMREDEFCAETFLRCMPDKLRADVKIALMQESEEAHTRQAYLATASKLWRNRGLTAAQYYFGTQVLVSKVDTEVQTDRSKKHVKANKVTVADSEDEDVPTVGQAGVVTSYQGPSTVYNPRQLQLAQPPVPQPQMQSPPVQGMPSWYGYNPPYWPYTPLTPQQLEQAAHVLRYAIQGSALIAQPIKQAVDKPRVEELDTDCEKPRDEQPTRQEGLLKRSDQGDEGYIKRFPKSGRRYPMNTGGHYGPARGSGEGRVNDHSGRKRDSSGNFKNNKSDYYRNVGEQAARA